MEDRICSENLCRICRENSKNVLNIFEEYHYHIKRRRPADMLEHCLQQPIAIDDNIPMTICTECSSKLISMYEFFVICEESEKYYLLYQHRHHQHQLIEDPIEVKTELINCTPEPIELLEVPIKYEEKIEEILTNEGEKVRLKYYECFICHRIYRRLKELRWHIKHHEKGTREYPCRVHTCNESFSGIKLRKAHMKFHSAEEIEASNPRFRCDLCEKEFRWNSELKQHMRVHTRQKPFKCVQCEKQFADKRYLKKHEKMHSADYKKMKKYLCGQCGQRYASSNSLKSHMKTHSDDRPFACEYCPSKFRMKIDLRTHILIHTGQKPFKCDAPGCNAIFRHRNSLKQHKIKNHIGIPRFHCSECLKPFYSKYKLQVHVRIHTGERPFKCDHCDRTFTQKGDMTKHMLIHLGPTPHKCTDCDASFRLETELRKHSYQHYTASASESNQS